MTTLIGLQFGDRCEIFADSRVTDDNGRIYSHPDMKKIVQKGSYLISGSGEVVPCDIAQSIWEPPHIPAKYKSDIYSFMIAKVMPSLRRCLTENGYNFDEDHDSKKDGQRFHLLIACNGELFDIDQELSVSRSELGIYTAGSGGEYAMGAILAGADPMEALRIAAKVSAFTAPPFYSIKQYKK